MGQLDAQGREILLGDLDTRPRLTPKVLFVLSLINLVDCINQVLLLPFVVHMVRDLLDTTSDDPDVAFWASTLVGATSFCELLLAPVWGRLADCLGRRPVMLLGLAGTALVPLWFGSASSVESALLARLVSGCFCGNIKPHLVLGELVDETNEAQAFGAFAFTYALGVVIGDGIGGMVSEPAAWAPGVFGGTVFERFPYLLPNVLFSSVILCALAMATLILEETRGSEPRIAERSSTEAAGQPRLFPIVGALSLLHGYTAARTQAYVLIVSYPTEIQGFGFGPQEIGSLQMTAAFVIIVIQLTVYAPVASRFNLVRLFVVGLTFTVLLTLPFPFYARSAGTPHGWFVVTGWQCLSQVGFAFSFPVCHLLFNRACGQENRGNVMGWANSLLALCRAVFPLASGALVAAGHELEPILPAARYLPLYVNLLTAFASMGLVVRGCTPGDSAEGQWATEVEMSAAAASAATSFATSPETPRIPLSSRTPRRGMIPRGFQADPRDEA